MSYSGEPGVHPARLVALVCLAQMLAQIGAFTWPALLPVFFQHWPMDNAQAGWVTGAFYGAYMLSVPILVSLTDRVDPRRVYLFGVTLTCFSHLGFALVVDDADSALVMRLIAGVGWAGTYMTGLKLLADRVDEKLMSRAVAGHAAGVGVSGALSFAVAGALEQLIGWRGAFVASGLCALLALWIAWRFVPARPQSAADDRSRSLLRGPWLPQFGPVLANRAALAYSIAYCVHTWEMSALRGWAVAFLAYVAMHTGGGGWFVPVAVTTAMGLLGAGASVFGNELAMRLGRARLVRAAMLCSALLASCLGLLGAHSYGLAATAVVLYAVLIWLDSSTLTAGAAGNADPRRRGATLALHSMLGYGGGLLGPVTLGWLLDLCGGMSTQGWTLAFLHLSIVGLLGRVLFVRLGPGALAGDRRS